MKKSFDYFKTLKELSCINQKSLGALIAGESFKNNMVVFNGKKYELLQRLSDDFVAPIERNDIYNLSHSLYKQYCHISFLFDFADDIDVFSGFAEEFDSVFLVQSDVISLFDKKSAYSALIKKCRQGQQMTLTLGHKISSELYLLLKGCSQPLYKLLLFSKIIDLCLVINATFCECERVAINNI